MPKRLLAHCYRPVYPSPAALVTSVSSAGLANIITLGEVFNLSIASPVIVGLAINPRRYSHQLIREAGEFVVNLPTVDIVAQVAQCGSVSGRTADKFALTGLTAVDATYVRPSLIAECPVNLECRLLDVIRVGDHDLFTGEVLAQHVDEEALREDGSIDIDRLRPFAFMLEEYRAIGGRIARR